MNTRHQPTPNREQRVRGFTLVELMVVMGIISLLVAIALPAFAAVKRAAKTTATAAAISTLNTGLEQFHADNTVGGAYPPSVRCNTLNPHGGGQGIEVGGANLLVWALAGADLLGSPGFRDVNSNTPNTEVPVIGSWTDDTGNTMGGGIAGLYYVNPIGGANAGKPYHPRSGPYVDLSKIKLTKQVGAGANAQFQIPSAPAFTQNYSHCFLDAFDQPILYYKANVNAPNFVSSGTSYVDPAGTYTPVSEASYNPAMNTPYQPVGVYDMRDNSVLTGNVAAQTQGIDMGAGPWHFGPSTGRSLGGNANPPPGSFGTQLRNPNVTTIFQAHRADSFILLSAGPDGIFGTADDVANFPINK